MRNNEVEILLNQLLSYIWLSITTTAMIMHHRFRFIVFNGLNWNKDKTDNHQTQFIK
jgi:hypothetical protein